MLIHQHPNSRSSSGGSPSFSQPRDTTRRMFGQTFSMFLLFSSFPTSWVGAGVVQTVKEHKEPCRELGGVEQTRICFGLFKVGTF